MADASLVYLSWLNLLVGDMMTGFGPFISVRLTVAGWDTGAIGAVLSAGTIAAVAAQVPAGLLVDGVVAKRPVAAAAIVGTMLALLLIAVRPGFAAVLAAEVIQGLTGAVLALAIAAITLTLIPHEALGERLGNNVRFAAIGAASGSVLLGLVGSAIGPTAVFVVAAACGVPAIWALRRIRGPGLLDAWMLRRGPVRLPLPLPKPLLLPMPARRQAGSPTLLPQTRRRLLGDRRLLAFLACAAAFNLSNAAQLPLAATEAAHRAGDWADIVTGAALTLPQVMVALLSPWVGRVAHRRGRRFVLLIGFAALPARAVLFALSGTPEMVVGAQALDGVSAAMFGVLLPLVIADITRKGGRFNFALGIAGVASALGAAVSNAAAGAVAQAAGLPFAFLALAALGAGATVLVWRIMPETAPHRAAHSAPHIAAPAR